MSKWKCCKKEPPETGKKVICQKNGDLYVAIRLKYYYIPMPFADHYFSTDLSSPQTWCEIDFPPNLTGHTRVGVEGNPVIITLAEAEKIYPEIFEEFSSAMISSLGTLKKPEKMT